MGPWPPSWAPAQGPAQLVLLKEIVVAGKSHKTKKWQNEEEENKKKMMRAQRKQKRGTASIVLAQLTLE